MNARVVPLGEVLVVRVQLAATQPAVMLLVVMLLEAMLLVVTLPEAMLLAEMPPAAMLLAEVPQAAMLLAEMLPEAR